MNSESKKPLLVYDGDCGICRYWVDYWQGFTGDRVEYQAYQDVASQYPDISVDQFRKSIQFIRDGKGYSGAQAVYVLLKDHFPYNFYLWLYHHLPGFAFLTEWFYNFFSERRGLLKTVSYLLWGRKHEPARYELTTWLFLRLLGLVYLAAFTSFITQVRGLIGAEGILPLYIYLERAQEYFGTLAWFKLPTVFWFSASDPVLTGICLAGMIFSLFLVLNFLTRTSLIILFVLWLSLVNAGQVFMQYQWDILLVECGFLAIFLPTRSVIVVWLYRWLAFRFMLLGGLVKLVSGDPTWDNLTALTYHFETQPLPTALGWYAHHLPEMVLMALTAATLFIELILPFFIFLTRNFRLVAAFGFILLQIAILLTGNYNYFNLLTLAFCLFLFDDAAIRRLVPHKFMGKVLPQDQSAIVSRTGFVIATCLAVIIVISSSALLWRFFTPSELPVVTYVARLVAPLNIVNNYGPFAVMTTVRNEIIIEGSNDKKYWEEYKFRYKPDDLDERPEWIIPHQPRLDWQMWFAVFGSVDNHPWFKNLLYRLLQNSSSVTRLLAHNPFPDSPPEYVRALVYEYHFSSEEQLQNEGLWWTREFASIYHHTAELPDD